MPVMPDSILGCNIFELRGGDLMQAIEACRLTELQVWASSKMPLRLSISLQSLRLRGERWPRFLCQLPTSLTNLSVMAYRIASMDSLTQDMGYISHLCRLKDLTLSYQLQGRSSALLKDFRSFTWWLPLVNISMPCFCTAYPLIKRCQLPMMIDWSVNQHHAVEYCTVGWIGWTMLAICISHQFQHSNFCRAEQDNLSGLTCARSADLCSFLGD